MLAHFLRIRAGLAFGVASLFALATQAQAQFIPPTLDPDKQVLTVNLVLPDTTPVSGSINAECDSILEVIGQNVHPAGDPFTYYWEWTNMTTNELVSGTPQLLINVPHTTTTYRFRVYNFDNEKWGETTLTVVSEDTTAPSIMLNGFFDVYVSCGNPYVEAGWTVADNCDESGDISVTVVGQVDPMTVGTYVLEYAATDSHNNSASTTRNVHVVYPWSGFKEPVDPGGKSVFKLGSTIPLKFELGGACANISNLNARLFLAKISNSIVGTEMEASSTSAADSGNIFRWVNGQYMYNLSTKGLSTGTWQLRVDLGDGAFNAIQISLIK